MKTIEQKACHKFIYKLHSKQLREADWDLDLPLDVALRDYPECIVSLNDSQILRFIDELNGTVDADKQAKEIKSNIKKVKRLQNSTKAKDSISGLYRQLYDLQYQKDYICIVMDRNSDYDRANLGFSVNGVEYRRFLGTNGGIKRSTIVYVSKRLYPELKRRLDNGRNLDKEIVPAKLEAYQALICSGSTPIPEPKGIIVVNDCITHFKDNIILINDELDGEPDLQYINDYEIEHTDSDGCGLMLPSYSEKVNQELTGKTGKTISGMNTRYAWTKGMIYTFNFVEFAEKVAGKYEIIDAWGDVRDVRDAEVILTTSMLKLWDSYNSWEDFYSNCQKNHYQFSAPKITPDELEHVRNTNYQFLQSYEFTDEELMDLCKPTIDAIKDVLGFDYRKAIVYIAGSGLNDTNVGYDNDYSYIAKALMYEPELIKDPFVVHTIYNMIKNKINKAKTGGIQIDANFAMIGGDPYALCQSMFGMEVTGLLNKGEVYHKYWIDKGASEIVCFRAPMTANNNIRKLALRKDEEVRHWYQYITTAIVLNAFDTTCDAMNGADKDGDTFMCTDNPILLQKTQNLPTIICMQHKVEKVVPAEEDIILSNKLAFNDDIGVVTNHITSMFNVQSAFDKDSEEYKALSYRIMCGQLFQQNTIDRAKGVIAKPMPRYWYERRDNLPKDEDSAEVAEQKKFNLKIVADRKPYFMIYIYPDLKRQYDAYEKRVNAKSIRLLNTGIQEIKSKAEHTELENSLLDDYNKYMPVGTNSCVINRICWLFEDEFKDFVVQNTSEENYDYSILKSGAAYSDYIYSKIEEVYSKFVEESRDHKTKTRKRRYDRFEAMLEHRSMADRFRRACSEICPNEDELCDIVLDICYSKESSKQFAWDMCGDIIIRNLRRRSHNIIRYPQVVEADGEFEYDGLQFVMREKEVDEVDVHFE